MKKPRFVVLAAVVSLAALSRCGGGGSGGGGAKFSTSVPGERPLGGLSDDELKQLCADGDRFAASASNKTSSCRLSALLAAGFTAAFSPDATDADLRAACSNAYSQCLNPPDGGAPEGSGQTCNHAAPSCTATVAEYTACTNDQAAETRQIAGQVPDCASLSRAYLAPADGGAAPTSPPTPASCAVVQSKCSGVSDDAKAFIDQYCALVGPCCTGAGGASQCTSVATAAAQQGTYDGVAAAACLQALGQQQAGAGFCAGLAAIQGGATTWAVIPACAPVFRATGGVGGASPGQPCSQDSDCPPGPAGATCLFSVVADDAGAPTTVHTCIQLTGNVGDACFGTAAAFGFTSSSPPSEGYLCDLGHGVRCDQDTRLCVQAAAAGAACGSIDECDGRTTYCDFATSRCAARLAPGASCAGGLLGECDGSAYCNATTKTCTPPGAAGAACSTGAIVIPPDCLSGTCVSGACTSPLSPVCL